MREFTFQSLKLKLQLMKTHKSIRFSVLLSFTIILVIFQNTAKAANPELGWGPDIKTGLNLHVALSGNDQHDGSEKAPFKSIAKAQNFIRTLKTSGGIPAGGVTVWIHGGRYQMAPLTFTSADNGTADKPVIYRAVKGEQVSFFTGKMIDPANWKPLNPEARKRVHPKINPDKLREIDIAALGIANANPFKDSFKDLGLCNSRELFSKAVTGGYAIPAVWQRAGTSLFRCMGSMRTIHRNR